MSNFMDGIETLCYSKTSLGKELEDLSLPSFL